MFTHYKLKKEGKAPPLTYNGLREAVLELFLSVKIRNDDEINDYNEDLFKLEKLDLVDKNGFDLVDLIKECVEKLMQIND